MVEPVNGTGSESDQARGFVCFGGTVLEEWTVSGGSLNALAYRYVRNPATDLGGGIGSIMYQLDGSDYRYYHYNHKGDVGALTEEDTDICAWYEYDAWGALVTEWEKSGVTNEFRFSTKQWDEAPAGPADQGLITFGARHYDPALARWTQLDPAGTVDGLNMYAYVGDSPILALDAWGAELTYKAPPQGPIVTRKCTSSGYKYWAPFWHTMYVPGCPGTATGAEILDIIQRTHKELAGPLKEAIGEVKPSLYQTGSWYQFLEFFYSMIGDKKCEGTCKRWTMKVRKGASMEGFGTYKLDAEGKPKNIGPARRIEVHTGFLGPVPGPCVTQGELSFWNKECKGKGGQAK